jgi:hypothetical protein
MSNTTNSKVIVQRTGLGFFPLLTLALIVLKLLGYVKLSWWIIAGVFFAPLAILLVIAGVISAVAGLGLFVAYLLDRPKKK